jgi:hypothetical protein
LRRHRAALEAATKTARTLGHLEDARDRVARAAAFAADVEQERAESRRRVLREQQRDAEEEARVAMEQAVIAAALIRRDPASAGLAMGDLLRLAEEERRRAKARERQREVAVAARRAPHPRPR